MAKLTSVVEFTDKEILDLLIEKAKVEIGKPTNGGVEIEIAAADHSSDRTLSGVSARVTFNGKAAK